MIPFHHYTTPPPSPLPRRDLLDTYQNFMVNFNSCLALAFILTIDVALLPLTEIDEEGC